MSQGAQEILDGIVRHVVELAKLLYSADPEVIREALFRAEQELLKLFSGSAPQVPVFESVITLVEAEFGGRFDDSELVPCLRHLSYIYFMLDLVLRILYHRLYNDYCSDVVCRRLMPTLLALHHLNSAKGIMHNLVLSISKEVAVLDEVANQIKHIDKDRFNIVVFAITKLTEALSQATQVEKTIQRAEREIHSLNIEFGKIEEKIRKLMDMIEEKKREM